MTPTVRAAGVLGAIALSALLLPAWLVLAMALLLVGATVADAWAVREPPAIHRSLRQILSRGVPSPLRIEAVARDSRGVLLRQPATPALTVQATAGHVALSGSLTAVKRGRHQLPGVASASAGPLGLARWHHALTDPTELLVYPDLPAARRLVLRVARGRSSRDGRLRRGQLGLGTDFESVREYSQGDDIRRLNPRVSARLGRPMSNQYRVEQDRTVICILDAGRLMAAPVGDRVLLDVALDAVATVALAADELGDRCGAITFDSELGQVLAPRRLGGRRVLDALFDLQPSFADSDFEKAFVQLSNSRRALLLVFTDLVDQAAARSLVSAIPMLAARHVVVVASVRDPQFERWEDPLAADEDPYLPLAAQAARQARGEATLNIRRAGAQSVDAPATMLSERCLQSYLRMRARARL